MPEVVTVTGLNGKEYSYPKARYTDPNRTDLRRKPEGRVGWQVGEMYERHHEIARRLILGQSGKEIAAALGVTDVTVSNVKNSPIVQDKLSIMRAARDAGTIELATEIANLAPIAVQRLKEALTTGEVFGQKVNATSILKEANNIIDREMGKPVQRVDTRSTTMHLTPDDLARIKERALEIAPTVDIELD